MLESLKMFTQYKGWATETSYSALEQVADAELHKQRRTNFKTIISTLNHIYVVDDIFKAHLRGTQHQYQQRNTEQQFSFKELWDKQRQMDVWYLDYVNALGGKDCAQRISFEYVGGGEGNMSVAEIILHIVNHNTYHRGFVSDMMYQIPAKPTANDLTVFLRDHYKPI
ncbi:MAG: DinB family protein [Pseudomonadales bacterium]|nr:DinB family protein [Pseudomonadales bacterium]NRA17548.1 DinB family protein [Oceanospirillaceae bacterium]